MRDRVRISAAVLVEGYTDEELQDAKKYLRLVVHAALDDHLHLVQKMLREGQTLHIERCQGRIERSKA